MHWYLVNLRLFMTEQVRLKLSNILKVAMGDLPQRKFAKDLGVSHVALRSWIECEQFPNQASVEKIAKFLGYGLEEFLAELRGEEIAPKVAEDLLPLARKLSSDEIARLIRMLADMQK